MLVICNGMLRSGSTLQYNVVRSLLTRTVGGTGHGIASTHPAHTLTLTDDLLTTLQRDAEWHVIKIHETHARLADAMDEDGLLIAYTYRDIRDVAASLKRIRNWQGDALTEQLDQSVETFVALNAIRAKHRDRFLWQRYEMMTAEPLRSAHDAARFLNVEADESTLREIVAEHSVENAQRATEGLRRELSEHVKKLRTKDPRAAAELLARIQQGKAIWTDLETQLTHNHISRDQGRAGTWRNVLSEREADEITERYRDWLTENGYIDSSEGPNS